MGSKIESLKPEAGNAALLALTDLKRDGVKVVVTSTLRTTDEQIALHAQGRKSLLEVNALRKKAGLWDISEAENYEVVTNCDGVEKKSAHQSGLAIDVVPMNEDGNPYWPSQKNPIWKKISWYFKQYGFEWGGDWKDFPDMPHYTYIGVKK